MPAPVDTHLLEPGSDRGYAVAGDSAVLSALVEAELGWSRVLVDCGGGPGGLVDDLATSLRESPVDLQSISARSAGGGNPVIPLVDDLRGRADGDARWVHSGLTSQDVLDTALMLVSRDVLDEVTEGLVSIGGALAGLAEKHRDTVMTGRTLTQSAVPITFGLKAAQWLVAVHEVLDEVQACRSSLPVQCGGAAGTLAALGVVVPETDATELAARWAARIGLTWPGAPWHTRRRPLTRVGDVLAAVASTLGHVGTDVATLSRPELGEVAESAEEGRGRSSTMPHKRNPVQAIVLRSLAVQAGPLAGVLHQCCALAVDERSDGAWHAEWPTLQRLFVVAVTASQMGESLMAGLDVDADAMGTHARSVSSDLLSERRALAGMFGEPEPESDVVSYLGSAGALVDAAVERWKGRRS